MLELKILTELKKQKLKARASFTGRFCLYGLRNSQLARAKFCGPFVRALSMGILASYDAKNFQRDPDLPQSHEDSALMIAISFWQVCLDYLGVSGRVKKTDSQAMKWPSSNQSRALCTEGVIFKSPQERRSNFTNRPPINLLQRYTSE